MGAKGNTVHTVDGSEIRRYSQLRLVVHPIIYKVLAPSQMVFAGFLNHQQYHFFDVSVAFAVSFSQLSPQPPPPKKKHFPSHEVCCPSFSFCHCETENSCKFFGCRNNINVRETCFHSHPPFLRLKQRETLDMFYTLED